MTVADEMTGKAMLYNQNGSFSMRYNPVATRNTDLQPRKSA